MAGFGVGKTHLVISHEKTDILRPGDRFKRLRRKHGALIMEEEMIGIGQCGQAAPWGRCLLEDSTGQNSS